MEFKKENIVFVNSDTLNSFGLDLSNPELITFNYDNINFEIIGGVNDVSLNQLRVSLKIQKTFNQNAVEVYRNQSIDLFNDNQLDYLVNTASDKIKVERTKLKEGVYSLVQAIEEYRKHKLYSTTATPKVKVNNKLLKDVKDYLKTDNLTESLQQLFESVGVADSKLALKLFILGLSRMTEKPLHTIIQGNILLSNEICKQFIKLINDEDLREATSLSHTAISHVPYPNYWDKKILVVHQLEGALSKKNSTLEEYMTNEQLNRYVTQQNQQTGHYNVEHKKVNDTFCVLGYTSKDFHKVFTNSNVVCLPLTNTANIKLKISEWELKGYAGLINDDEVDKSIQFIQTMQRVLEPVPIINPYVDQLEFQKFFDNDVKKIKQFMQITNLVALLHRFQLNPKKKNGQVYYEVQPEHILLTLDLFKELWVTNYDELYFQVICTFNQIKKTIKKENPDKYEEAMFTEKELLAKIKISPATLNRHIQKLTLYNKINRVFGNNRIGYHYSVTNWNENESDKDKFIEFRQQVEEMINPEVYHAPIAV